MKTWHMENLFVALVLGAVVVATGGRWVEWVGAAAVFSGFCHASIAERMREREAARPVPSVECHRLATVFFLAKEGGWLVYFVALHAWSALVGCGVFLAYPLWRKVWRRWHPLVLALALEGCSSPDPKQECLDRCIYRQWPDLNNECIAACERAKRDGLEEP